MANTIVVVGAGVSGLTSALVLARRKDNEVTVVAEHMPGDFSAEYASPWAGANFLPLHAEAQSAWERRTWRELKHLAANVPEAGVHFQKIQIQRRQKDMKDPHSAFPGAFAENPWFKVLFDDFQELTPSELAPGYDAGYQFTSVCINTAIYLPWLLGQCAKSGVVFRRTCLVHIREAKQMSHTGKLATIVINATGLGSRFLGGVNDQSMLPARGQTVLVQNPIPAMFMFSGADDGPTEETYMMQRAVGGGTILGGTYEIGNWDVIPDANIAMRILQRVLDVCPTIAEGKGMRGLRIVKHAVGFRPFRPGGVRLEKQSLDRDTFVIHNYGHDSWGYIGSYGCAEEVVRLIESHKARL
ncbi:FAD dependent oxidoreductase [Aspergillus bertholletiae]|uniref:FAD dependent oxidoreductase n=1 Tax=Aspergillus bertholletiae TaxID=1226010 RepID=A0A5N7BJ86_9EURO|nr:FAD dependent oxidoreductase [Aspergillus bertholletiae]